MAMEVILLFTFWLFHTPSPWSHKGRSGDRLEDCPYWTLITAAAARIFTLGGRL